ncbi:hypothetical protein D0T50_10130 [Bacteroides sp. 214]|uniref:tetratricopeptide repeat protein n=1 Tax=Bacteroides sp. 214 TaxID=2302935 RepID=UPI0013D82302|nr:hypothetical protein [Bacteroides sp. 214]NDW13252.1 hypothetical protein [Bacteroides sp. 214]
MRIKTLIASLFLSGFALTTFAQTENCNSNSSISHEAVKAGNYKDAYLPWKEVMKDCPTLRYYTYSDGFDILKYFLEKETTKGTPEYKAYFDELMAAHDQLMEYTPELQKKAKGIRSVARSTGMKALDYLQFAPEVDANVAYNWLKESVSVEQSKTSAALLFYFLQSSYNKLKADPSHSEVFIQDYLNASQWADEAIANTDRENVKQSFVATKDNLVALFINSGAADCESLQAIYAPKVEENKTDLEYLKKVIEIMRMMKCTESDAYFQASLYSYQIEPTAGAAAGCAAMAYKKGDVDDSVKFFDEAIELEDDDVVKAEYAYKVAVVLSSVNKFGQARAYAQKAININGNYGAPYILIARLYAANYKWSDESALNKCTYFVVIDKLQRAKAVDSSVADEANELIRAYSPHTPAASELFMLGYKVGDTVTVGGWIGETTKIR